MNDLPQLKQSNISNDHCRLRPLVRGIRWVIASGLLVGSNVSTADTPLPVPTFNAITPGLVPVPIIANAANGQATAAIAGNAMNIRQITDKATIDWKSFNIDHGYSVNFQQPNTSSVALNRIHDANATQILGALNANGQVYLLNTNGILFGNGSQVNTNGLVASALNITDETLKNGLFQVLDKNINAEQLEIKAALNGNTNDLSTAVNPDAKIDVAAGANIHVGKNGNIILAAPTVTNSGAISADEQGQILLVASKDTVYLQPTSSKDPFAGLLVEVGTGGKVSNEVSGAIATRQGNITLAGFAVNQLGRISATTSVNVSGSVRLLARESAQVNVENGKSSLIATQTVRDNDLNDGLETESAVTFGENSSVKVLADANGGSSIDSITQNKSLVEVSADKINMKSGSSIIATSGNVNFQATNNLVDPLFSGTQGRIVLEKNSLIDVSGSKNVTVAMERNVADVSVQSFNLRDAPNQRGGVLQGKTIKVDVRNLPTIVDASSAKDAIKRDINERLGSGGTINLKSSGDVIVNTGAVSDISGGGVVYKSGYIKTTGLIDAVTGQVVDISSANPNKYYSGMHGIITEAHSKWGVTKSWGTLSEPSRYESGYTEGKAGGALNIQSPITAWAGQVKAGTVSSQYQRSTPASGGAFTINRDDNGNGAFPVEEFLSSQDVSFQNKSQVQALGIQDLGINDDLPSDTPLTLSSDLVNRSGLSDINIKTRGVVTVAENTKLSMPILGNLSIDAANIDVLGSVSTSGGNITLNALANPNIDTSGQINLRENSQLNVSGRWINDFKEGITTPLAINAGTVNLKANDQINFEKGSTIKADGGAQLAVSGNTVTAGNAGTIKIQGSNISFGESMQTKGVLSAIGINQGGTLNLITSKITIGGDSSESDGLNLGVTNRALDIVANAGFRNINLTSNDQDITVKENTDMSFITQNRLLDASFKYQSGSSSLANFSQVTVLPESRRKSMSLALNGLTGVTLETGSKMHVDKASTVDITAGNGGSGVYINGLIDAKGGAINLNMTVANPSLDYHPSEGIFLGSNAILNTQGTTLLDPMSWTGLTTGSVLNGGNINVNADRGYVVFAEGSTVKADGTRASIDLPTLVSMQKTKQLVGSDAGRINIRAAEGIILDGSLSAQKGLSRNHGGELSLTLDRSSRGESLSPNFTSNVLHIDVVAEDTKMLSDILEVGSVIPDSLNGQAIVSSDKMAKAGIDDLKLTIPYQIDPQTSLARPSGEIRFLGDVNLNAASSIILDTQTIKSGSDDDISTAGVATLNTGYLKIGSSTINGYSKVNIDEDGNAVETIDNITDGSVKGDGSLTGNADYIELQGASLLTGFNDVNLSSLHDMRAVGVYSPTGTTKTLSGALTTAANLNLDASQIYPTTLTQFTINLPEPGSELTISGHNTDITPLSAAGNLTINASTINQNGVLKAPLGTIALNADTSLLFGEHSYTSVSAEGQVIPFGTILNNVWLYPLSTAGNQVFNTLPDNISLGEKHLAFTSPDIQFDKGSVVNVSGGGNLMAATFQPGIGGSNDYLASDSSSYQGGFAILPSLGRSLAPYDVNLSANFNYDPRAEVYLSGTADLPAGFYAILPTQFALLPGGFLVTPQNNTVNQLTTTETVNGLPIVSGYQTIAGTNIRSSLNSGFLIESSAEVKKHSQYDIQMANDFLTQQAVANNTSVPLLPEDSGQISINASDKLRLDGEFKVRTSNGRGAKMDISAKNIEVVNELSDSSTALQILAEDLNNLQVDSLLLGGARHFDNVTGNTDLTVIADNVIFDQSVNVKTLDLLAVGTNSVEVKEGASINSSGRVNSGDSVFNITDDSAFLRVSADNQVQVNRSYLPESIRGLTGDLLINQGATLSASKSIFLDASKSTILNGDLTMSGGSINMSANEINLGEVADITSDSLNLTSQNLSNLVGNDLTLTSRGSINFYGNIGQLDSNNSSTPVQFKHLVLDAAALSGYDNEGKAAMIQAKTIDLQNSNGVSAASTGSGTGLLELTANQFNQGAGTVTLDGFSKVNINVDQQFTATGNSVVNLASDLNLKSGLLNTSGGHSLLIDASSGGGHDVLISGNSNNTQILSNDFGGHIGVVANNITLQDAKVMLPSGSLKLNAEDGDIAVNGKTLINLAGQAVNFADLVSYTPGGTFSAISTNGGVSLGSESTIDISTGGGNALGGNLILKAPQKTLEMAGTLKATGASATIDVSSFLPSQGFDNLMNKLKDAGVTESLYLRSRLSDIVQVAGNAINAKAISLVADTGSIDINGTISTDNATQAGDINLYAGNNITLESGSMLSATGAKGGNILLSALGTTTVPGGIISIENGSSINVTGTSSRSGTTSEGGTVTLNAMRADTVNENGINIAPIAGTVTGAKGFNAVGFQKYYATDFTSSKFTNIVDVVANLSDSIPSDISGYLSGVYPDTDLTDLSGIITSDISNYLANVSYYTSTDIPALSGIITADVSTYMNNNASSITSDDISTIASAIATQMSVYLTSDKTDLTGLSSTIKTDLNSYMANASAIEAYLGQGIVLRTGVEIDNVSGDATLKSAWDFSGLSNNGLLGTDGLPVNINTDPSITYEKPIVGDLIVRSAGQLNINASLTDGYLNGGPKLMNSDSWSFQLVSGADLSSADTMATNSLTVADKLNNPAMSDLTLGSGASVHTGTGDIKLASGENIVFADQTATVYNGGRLTEIDPYGTLDNNQIGTGSLADQTLYTTDLDAGYPIAGGTLIFRAGANIMGAVSNQFIQAVPYESPSWLEVQGDVGNLTAWMVNASYFQQNVGSFGGGMIDIAAAGNITDLSVMMPTTGKQLGTDFSNSKFDVQGGGKMVVAADGNISGGAFFLGKGVGTITAAGEIKGSNSTDENAFVLGPQLVMSGNQSDAVGGDTLLTLNGNKGIKISGVSDEMVLNNGGTQFFSYTENSKLTLNSLAGDIHLNSDTTVISNILRLDTETNQRYLAHVYPASLDAIAFNGSVKLDSDIILFPAPVSNVNVLAEQDITSNNGQYSLTMSDADNALIGNALHPMVLGNSDDPVYSIFNTLALNAGSTAAIFHADTPRHIADKTPARLVTQQGDISSVQVNLPKQSIIQAGKDLLNSSIKIQQINPSDASIISAGRDIKYVTDLDSDGSPTAKNDLYKIEIAGPGDVLVKTGRNLDFGASAGLTSVGNILNPALSAMGSNLNVLVGLNAGTPRYVDFINKYLLDNPLYVDKYTQVKSLITPFMQQLTGNKSLSDAQALVAFSNLESDQTLSIQSQLHSIVTPVFFNELIIAGTASATNKSQGNAGGYAAIDTLFPGAKWQGDMNLVYSKLQTLNGGDINLTVPGGQINAGLAIAPSGAGAKTADQLGIVTQGEGSINTFVKNDFIVNTSRVFTLGGGDIVIWSSDGDIDAGSGPKGALSVTVDPPYRDANDMLVIPAPKITSGSGIRTAAGTGDPGSVFLFAPKGVVDAGEAGIGGKNVTISATAVLGANNISVSGVSTGVPAQSSGSVAAGLTGASNMTSNVTQVSETATGVNDKEGAESNNAPMGLLRVEVIGMGEEEG